MIAKYTFLIRLRQTKVIHLDIKTITASFPVFVCLDKKRASLQITITSVIPWDLPYFFLSLTPSRQLSSLTTLRRPCWSTNLNLPATEAHSSLQILLQILCVRIEPWTSPGLRTAWIMNGSHSGCSLPTSFAVLKDTLGAFIPAPKLGLRLRFISPMVL